MHEGYVRPFYKLVKRFIRLDVSRIDFYLESLLV